MHDVSLTHEMARLTLQLGVLLLAAHSFGMMARRLGLTSLIGEMFAGILLGPFALGSLPLPGFSDGLFPLFDPSFPISELLYGFAVVGAIVHVFFAGLESDPGFLSRIRLRGVAIALSGAAFGLAAGALIAVYILDVPSGSPTMVFFMALSVSTSIGVQARILANRHRLAAPEGSVILGSSLFHDGLAIVLLSAAVTIAGAGATEVGLTEVGRAVPALLLALAVWVGSYALLIGFAPRVTLGISRVMSAGTIAVLSLAAALLVSGLFEVAGIASVAGAYGVGLALSRTELATSFAQRVKPLTGFFIPILYAVLGMFMDLRVVFTPEILLPALGLAVGSAVAKSLGAMLAGRPGGFTWYGGLLLGVGTVPRGEVGVVIAAVGIATGMLTLELVKIMMVMIVLSTIVATPLFSRLLRSERARTVNREGKREHTVRTVHFPNEELAELVNGALLRSFENDGFRIHQMDIDGAVYSLRRGLRALTLRRRPLGVQLSGDAAEAPFLSTVLHEAIIHVNERIRALTAVEVPAELRRELMQAPEADVATDTATNDTREPAETGDPGRGREDDGAAKPRTSRTPGRARSNINLFDYLNEAYVALPLHSRTREDCIVELVDVLVGGGKIRDRDAVISDVLHRERSFGTGLGHGVALPHARSDGVDEVVLAVGVSRQGIDFEAADGSAAHLVVLVVSPREHKGPHLQVMAAVTARLRDPATREAAVQAESAAAVVGALS